MSTDFIVKIASVNLRTVTKCAIVIDRAKSSTVVIIVKLVCLIVIAEISAFGPRNF
jgi:hypothetical protein